MGTLGATIRDMRLWLKVLLICSLPVAFAGLGYLYMTVLWQPPLIFHSCPHLAPASACSYHPLLVSGYTWTVLGALVGLWVAYVLSQALFTGKKAALTIGELATVTPVVVAVVWWTFRDGLLQAGTRSEQAHVLVVVFVSIMARLAFSLSLGRRPPRGLGGTLLLADRDVASICPLSADARTSATVGLSQDLASGLKDLRRGEHRLNLGVLTTEVRPTQAGNHRVVVVHTSNNDVDVLLCIANAHTIRP